MLRSRARTVVGNKQDIIRRNHKKQCGGHRDFSFQTHTFSPPSLSFKRGALTKTRACLLIYVYVDESSRVLYRLLLHFVAAFQTEISYGSGVSISSSSDSPGLVSLHDQRVTFGTFRRTHAFPGDFLHLRRRLILLGKRDISESRSRDILSNGDIHIDHKNGLPI